MLEEKKNNYIMCIYKEGIYFGLSVCDISTGEFLSTKIAENNNFALLLDEISKYNPAELIINKMLFNCAEEIKEIKLKFNLYINCLEDTKFQVKDIDSIFLFITPPSNLTYKAFQSF